MRQALRFFGKLAKPILRRTLYRPGQVARILCGPGRGLRYQIYPGFGLAHIYGGWEPDAQQAMLEYVRPGGVAYDLGANYGLHSLLMARLVAPVGTVYAFEPMPAIYAELVQNVRLNHFNHVACVRKAVSDRIGRGRFLVGHHDGAGHLANGGRGDLASPSAAASFDVEETTLDAFIRQGGRPQTFIKVDVEGSEAAALRGARTVLAEHRPVLLVELHTPQQDVAVGRLLRDLEYTVGRVDKRAPPVVNLTSGWPDPNGLWGQVMAVPAERAARTRTR